MRALIVCCVLLGAPRANAQERQRLVVGLEAVSGLSLTPARTQGGVGGGLSLAYELTPQWQLEANVAWLVGVGSNTLLRLGAAWQRAGFWRPQLRAEVELGLGGALDFDVRARGPTVGLTVGVSPLRFEFEHFILSALELRVGPSTEFVSFGWRAGLTLFSISVPVWVPEQGRHRGPPG